MKNLSSHFLLLILISASCTATRADYTAAIESSIGQVWRGWGCSLSWWANVWGNREDVAQLLFTTKWVKLTEVNTMLPGLGMEIARYNLGGCGDGMADVGLGTFPSFKRIEAFWVNWFSDDVSSTSWDWTKDAKQRNMLSLAKSLGVQEFELFANTPVWWMNVNKKTNGADTSQVDCLTTWNQGTYAKYLAKTLKYFYKKWGIQFDYVEPFNEPTAWWWTSAGGQEGCYFSKGLQRTILRNLQSALAAEGLWDPSESTSVRIAASDENAVDDAIDTWKALAPDERSLVSKINVHGYYGLEPYRGKRRAELRNLTAGMEISVSEYGDNDADGMTLADSIARDLAELRAVSWVYWQPVDGLKWGLIYGDMSTGKIASEPWTKYFIFAQFSRHVRRGMLMLRGNDQNTVAAYDWKRSVLVLVTVNFATPQWVTYNLAKFSSAAGPISRWQTRADGTERYTYRGGASADLKMENNKVFYAWFPANTVQTIEISNVRL